jgi:P-type Ca2+ transporter type 2C
MSHPIPEKRLVRPQAEVIRGGHAVVLPVEDVVLGDILVLKPGSYVAADARVIEAVDLSVDESMLAGENLPAIKKKREIESRRPAPGRS